MDRPYVEWMRVEDYRCIRSVDVHLTPLHAFIGPNDSGKSSLLRAFMGQRTTHLWVTGQDGGASYHHAGASFAGEYPQITEHHPRGSGDKVKATQPVALLRLDPDELRRAVPLISKGNPLWFQNERGLGLAALYDALQTRDFDKYLATNTRFTELFPSAKALRLENPSQGSKAMGITLQDKTEVAADEMSEGMLYWLAFAIIEHLAPHAILLVEEPENGLHPSRIADVMRVFRYVSKHTQVVLATHSPLVINELLPEEVTIVTRTRERGTICTPMTATKHFEQRSKIYALGELWLSYADGELEKELVETDPPSKDVAAS